MRRDRRPDYPLVIVALLLSAFGIAMVYSAGQTDYPTAVANLWRQQLTWLVLGLAAAWITSRASSRVLDFLTTPAYVGSCFVLLVLIFIGSRYGVHSALAVGLIGLVQVVPIVLAVSAILIFLVRLAVQSQRRRSVTGASIVHLHAVF